MFTARYGLGLENINPVNTPYQKDEPAYSGNLLTKLCSLSLTHPHIKTYLTHFLFSVFSNIPISLSVQANNRFLFSVIYIYIYI